MNDRELELLADLVKQASLWDYITGIPIGLYRGAQNLVFKFTWPKTVEEARKRLGMLYKQHPELKGLVQIDATGNIQYRPEVISKALSSYLPPAFSDLLKFNPETGKVGLNPDAVKYKLLPLAGLGIGVPALFAFLLGRILGSRSAGREPEPERKYLPSPEGYPIQPYTASYFGGNPRYGGLYR